MSDLEEPNFNMERDLIIMVKDEKVFSSPSKKADTKVNIIILSYNRPRMLRETIKSVVNQTYPNMDIYVCDDGSDFDVWEAIGEFEDERLLLYQAPRIELSERVSRSRVAENITNILDEITDGVVCYICDDDIMAPEWIARSLTGFDSYPDAHVVAGESWYFHDGEHWQKDAKYGMELYERSGIPTAYWATGSFLHRMECYWDEGLKWKDNLHGHSQDANFIMDLWSLHADYIYIPVPAVYRREHEKSLSSKLGRKGPDGLYKPGFIPPPATAEMMEGMME